MQSDDHRWLKVLPPVLLCATLWGSAFPGIKTIYRLWAESDVQPGLAEYWWLGGMRFTLAGAGLLLVSRQAFAEIRRTPLRKLIAFTLTQTFGQYLLFYYGISVASGALAGLLTAAGSFWWMILAPMVGGAPRPTRGQWLAVVVGAVGVTLAAAAPGADAGRPWLGTCVLLGSSFLGILGLVQFGALRPTIGARAATGFSLLGGGLGLLLAGAPAFARVPELMPLPVLGITLWLAFVSAFAFSLWNHLSTRHPVPLLAGYRFLIPLMAMLESLLLLDERPGWGLWIGAALVIGALVFAQRAHRSGKIVS
ncbi:MAG TPA: DMT family transporter [Luteolibacter sp.]|nr:DMT family transporter [Luteolibacter sp.]